jgi:hypothetical protein
MYSGKWCRVSLGICWENSPLSSNWLFLFKIFGLTLFELQIRQCFASFLPTSQFSSTFQVSGLFVLLDFFDLFFRPLWYFWIFGYCRLFGYDYPSFLFSFFVDLSWDAKTFIS